MKLQQLIPTALLGVAGATLVGLVALQTPAISAGDADEVVKRDENAVELVLVGDDDDDDTNDRNSNTGLTREDDSRDKSHDTDASRDDSRDDSRDVSRDDSRDVSRG